MIRSGDIEQVFKSRKHIIELLKYQGYGIAKYGGFGVHEVHSMFKANEMDMLVEKPGKKAYVAYHLEKMLRVVNIQEYIDDLMILEKFLTKNDDIIIIIKDEPNESLVKILKNTWEQQGIFITVFNIKRLQFNILNHELVPPHRVLNDEEKEVVKQRYHIARDSDVPDIGRFSPVAMAIGMRPGQMCEVTRTSRTAISTKFYRICSR